jgi:hypothetical protein
MVELQTALAIEIGSRFLKPDRIPEETEIIRICGGLISLKEESSLVVFSHESVKPFLRDNKLEQLPSHLVLAETCLTYIQFPLFAALAGVLVDAREFASYAACYFSVHLRLQSEGARRIYILEESMGTPLPLRRSVSSGSGISAEVSQGRLSLKANSI